MVQALTIRKEEEFVICSHCKSSNFNNIKSEPSKFNAGGAKLIECVKRGCKAIRDLKLVSEDIKHTIYHETGKQPEHIDLFEKA